MENEALSVTVRCEATMKKITSEYTTNLVTHIKNIYNYSSKTTVTNNQIDYYYANIYDTDSDDNTSGGLMNDRLGGAQTLSSGIGNIRYYGANPNNYVDIGDTYTVATTISNFEKNSMLMSSFEIETEESCKTFFDCSTNYGEIGSLFDMTYANEAECLLGLKNDYHVSSVNEICGIEEKQVGDPKLYRIIGLFKDIETSTGEKKDLVKVIREDSIGDFAWDLTGTSEEDYTFDNNWHDATLMTILNNGYYNSSNSVFHSYYDWENDVYISATIDLSTKGLNSSVHNKIESVVWNLGGYNNSGIYPNDIYKYEREDAKCTNCTYDTTWPGKIALMYISDYSYGIDLSVCSSTIDSYYDPVCRYNDWLASTVNGNFTDWLLAPHSNRDNIVWTGESSIYFVDGDVNYRNGVRPVFYLTSDVGVVSGSGSKTDPYVVR